MAKKQKIKLEVIVRDSGGAKSPVSDAPVTVESVVVAAALAQQQAGAPPRPKRVHVTQNTDAQGRVVFDLALGDYEIKTEAFGFDAKKGPINLTKKASVELELPLDLEIETFLQAGGAQNEFTEGEVALLKIQPPGNPDDYVVSWKVSGGSIVERPSDQNAAEIHWDTTGLRGSYEATVTLTGKNSPSISVTRRSTVLPRPVLRVGTVPVTMRRTANVPTSDLPLWIVIRKSTEAMSFINYNRFMNHVLCGEPLSTDLSAYEHGKVVNEKVPKYAALKDKRYLPFTDSDAYRILKIATEAFVVVNCGVNLANFTFDSDDPGPARDVSSREKAIPSSHGRTGRATCSSHTMPAHTTSSFLAHWEAARTTPRQSRRLVTPIDIGERRINGEIATGRTGRRE